jgi:hypothetical protein
LCRLRQFPLVSLPSCKTNIQKQLRNDTVGLGVCPNNSVSAATVTIFCCYHRNVRPNTGSFPRRRESLFSLTLKSNLRRIADFTSWCRLPTLLLGVGCTNSRWCHSWIAST